VVVVVVVVAVDGVFVSLFRVFGFEVFNFGIAFIREIVFVVVAVVVIIIIIIIIFCGNDAVVSDL